MGKKREANTSSSGPGNSGADSGVSSVRGNDSPTVVTNLPGVSGLSGVRTDNPDRKPQEVSPAPEKVAKRSLTIGELSLDEKVSILNALRAIRSKTPKVKDQKAQALIDALYVKWVDETMLQILAPQAASQSFQQQEIDALKVLAQTILQRQQGSAARPAPAPMVPRTGANSQPVPQPLVDGGVNDAKFRKAQMDFLQEISKLEREGPEF